MGVMRASRSVNSYNTRRDEPAACREDLLSGLRVAGVREARSPHTSRSPPMRLNPFSGMR